MTILADILALAFTLAFVFGLAWLASHTTIGRLAEHRWYRLGREARQNIMQWAVIAALLGPILLAAVYVQIWR